MNLLTAHIPILMVLLPLFGALAAGLCRSPRNAWLVAQIVLVLMFLCMCRASYILSPDASMFYLLGGLKSSVGIQLQVDSLNMFLLWIIVLVGVPGILYMRHALEAELEQARQPLAYACLLLCIMGLTGMAVTHDAFNLYVFLEISSLATYALISLGRNRKALSAAFQYLLLGTIGATFMLIGIGLIYIMTGTLNMSLMADALAGQPAMPVLAAYAFIAAGLMLKMGLFPLHFWLPDAYNHAPSSIMPIMAGMTTKLSAYALLRLLLTLHGQPQLGPLLMLCGAFAMLAGSVAAWRQDQLRRMLAFSSIAHMGYIALGIGLSTPAGLVAALTMMLSHALTKATLFMAAGNMAWKLARPATLADIRGMAAILPYSSMAFLLASFAMLGLPFTVGFIAKWQLIAALLSQPLWLAIPLVASVILSTLLALAYLWKVAEALYARTDALKPGQDIPRTMLVPLGMLLAAICYLGLDARYLEWAHTAARIFWPEGGSA